MREPGSRGRKGAARRLGVVAVLAVLLTGCAPMPSPSGAGAGSGLPAPSGSPAATSGTADAGVPPLAASVLGTLTVAAADPMTGYSRAAFGPAWTDDNDDADGHDGCDTRDDILRRDLTAIVTAADGCTVTSGTLADPYTGRAIAFVRGVGTSTAVQIDHVVALGDAWQTGAAAWTAARRTDLANDPRELLAVDGPANEAKGDADASAWLPPDPAGRCAYVARQVGVKAVYGLWVTAAEKSAMGAVLATCPGQRLPFALAGAGGPAPAPSGGAGAGGSSPSASAQVVHAGSFCSPSGARGRTAAGTPMVCGPDSTGKHLRWQAAG